MSRQIFILVPSDVNTSPISGAYALVNGACRAGRNVTLVTLKQGDGANMPLEPGVKKISLHAAGRTWLERRRAYRNMLVSAGGRQGVASISMCFSADLVNSTCGDVARTICSIRGNLREAYRLRYGVPGLALAKLHHRRLRHFDAVGAMSETMREQLQRVARVDAFVAGNFIDEPVFEPVRRRARDHDKKRFVSVGSLTHGKQPGLLLEAFANLVSRGGDFGLDFVGDGPLRDALEQRSIDLGVGDRVVFHGFLSNPIEVVAQADVFVLPSLSEGVSRAALEALFVGVPCVARAVDANGEMIEDDINGALFHSDRELGSAMIRVASLARPASDERPILIPPMFRQHTAVARYLEEADQAP